MIKSELTSSQQLNLADALDKLRNVIKLVMVKPPETSEETRQKITKRQFLAAQRRVFAKRMRSQIKRGRQETDF